LAASLKTLQSAGYLYSGYIKTEIELLKTTWAPAPSHVLSGIDRYVASLQEAAHATERLAQQTLQAQPTSNQSPSVPSLDKQLVAVRSFLQKPYEDLARAATDIQAQLDKTEMALAWGKEASFDWKINEALFMAANAQLVEEQSNQSNPKGILYLTDKRLLFEEKGERAKAKFWFITLSTEYVQHLLFEVSLDQIKDTQEQDTRRLFRKHELLKVQFADSASRSSAVFELDGAANEEWMRAINAICHGQIHRTE
jgi:hypothetical protein